MRATTIAPITLTTEAIRMCPSAPSMTSPSTFAYSTMMEPATVDIPAVNTMKSSERDRFFR